MDNLRSFTWFPHSFWTVVSPYLPHTSHNESCQHLVFPTRKFGWRAYNNVVNLNTKVIKHKRTHRQNLWKPRIVRHHCVQFCTYFEAYFFTFYLERTLLLLLFTWRMWYREIQLELKNRPPAPTHRFSRLQRENRGRLRQMVPSKIF